MLRYPQSSGGLKDDGLSMDGRHAAEVSSTESKGLYVYSVPVSLLLGLQHWVSCSLCLLSSPLRLCRWLHLLPDDPARGRLLAGIFLSTGLATVLQALFAARLPVMLSPSLMFSSAVDGLRKTQEGETDGDLYAMGADLRASHFLERSAELRGLVALLSLSLAALFGLGWLVKVKLPRSTMVATLLASCIYGIQNFMPIYNPEETNIWKSSLTLLTFILLLMFFICGDIEVPYLKLMASGDQKIRLRIFQVFGVFMTFCICVMVNVSWELDIETCLGRTLESHPWLSVNFLPHELTLPTLTWRIWILLPVLLSQTLTSYSCYCLMEKQQGKQSLAIISECLINSLFALLGIVQPLGVEPTSLGLWALTEMRNNEATAISGSLLSVISGFLQVVALSGYAPTSLLYAIFAYLQGHIIAKGISSYSHRVTVLKQEKESITNESQNIIVSVLIGMMISHFTPDFKGTKDYGILFAFLRSPILITFLISFILKITKIKRI